MSLEALPPHVQALLARVRAGERNIRFSSQQFAAFDAEAARKLTQANYADLTMPPRVIDVLLRRPSPVVSWQQVRQLWLGQLKHAVTPTALMCWYQQVAAQLAGAINSQSVDTHPSSHNSQSVDTHPSSHSQEPQSVDTHHSLDLVRLIHRIFAGQLTDLVLTGLPPADAALLRRNQAASLAFLLDENPTDESRWQRWQRQWRSIQVGNVVRRALRQRVNGKQARQTDLADSIISLLPDLGIGRAVDTVVMALTAVNGPPGAAAICLLYECQQQPAWFAKVCAELQSLSAEQLCADPLRLAPLSQRFIKEVLRLWNVPVLVRQARADLQWQQEHIAKDSVLMFSPFFIHRNPEYWPEPDRFNPDRWLADSPQASVCPHTYVPFGWAPKSCIGALLGSHQLLLLLHVFATRFQWQLTEPAALSITMTALPQPVNFQVHLQHRTQLNPPMSEQLSAPAGPNPATQPRHTGSAATGCPFGHPKQTASQPVVQEMR
jgi:cytochrome P450